MKIKNTYWLLLMIVISFLVGFYGNIREILLFLIGGMLGVYLNRAVYISER